MSWNLWARSPGLAELGREPPDDEGADEDDGVGRPSVETEDDQPTTPAVHLLAEPPNAVVGRSRTGHVRAVPRPDLEGARGTTGLPRRGRSPHAPERSSLRELGLPDHLVPPEGGIFPLLNLLERAPQPRLPKLRAGDEVLVVTVGCATAARASARQPDPAAVAEETSRTFAAAGLDLPEDQVIALRWPQEDDEHRTVAAERALAASVAAQRARIELIRIEADCPPTVAYAVCRALPMAQLHLLDVLRAHRPAAPLGWGAPIAFLDGRRSSPAVIAAVLADRLAGGVA